MAGQVFNLQGLNLNLSPLVQPSGQFTRLVNVDNYPTGALTKRAGYATLLGTPDGSAVTSLFDWHHQNGTQFELYRKSGSILYHSLQGTGAWTISGNGTFTAGSAVGYGVLGAVMIAGDGVGSTRHTTNGTSFTNTTLAPAAAQFAEYKGRVYAMGGSAFTYSVANDATNWGVSGTSDSASVVIPGAGNLNAIFKAADRIITSKNSGIMHRWDGYNLYDLSTRLGPSSGYSIGSIEDYRFYLNRNGYYGFNGDRPEILSHPIRSQIYNDLGSGIAGGTFDTSAGVAHKYDYYASVGAVMDDFTNEPLTNGLQVYNYQLDTWRNYDLGTTVASLWSYTDNNRQQQLIFGDSTGQVYTLGGTNTTDNGLPITSVIEFIFHDGMPELEKAFNYIWLFFNPGCEAHIQVAVGNTYTKGKKQWVNLGDATNGVVEYKFSGQRGRILFVKISESSRNARFTYYGASISYTPINRN